MKQDDQLGQVNRDSALRPDRNMAEREVIERARVRRDPQSVWLETGVPETGAHGAGGSGVSDWMGLVRSLALPLSIVIAGAIIGIALAFAG